MAFELDWLHEYAERWHDAWEIVGAVATAVAVAVALAGIVHERRVAHEQRQRAEAAEAALAADRREAAAAQEASATMRAERERRAQAQLVIGWPEFKVRRRFAGGNYVGQWVIKVGNYSSAPVFDVLVEGHDSRLNEVTAHGNVAVLAPGSTPSLESDHYDEERPPLVVTYFRDLAGIRWKRYQNGELEEVQGQHHGIA